MQKWFFAYEASREKAMVMIVIVHIVMVFCVDNFHQRCSMEMNVCVCLCFMCN